MSLNASKSRLTAVTKELSARWTQTKESWRDTQAAEFEQKYMLELFTSVDTAAGVIEQLDKLLRQIRSDCE